MAKNKDSWWTEQRVTLLKELGPSTSTSRIADILGTTKNAVIGKAHRDGLALCPPPVGKEHDRYDADKRRARHLANRAQDLARMRERYERTVGHPVARRYPREDQPRMRSAQADEPAPLNLSFNQLTATSCRWPTTGIGSATCYCGHCIEGLSYCSWHHRLAHSYHSEKRR